VGEALTEDLHRLFQQCMQLAEELPVEHRAALLEIADQLLKLAGGKPEELGPQQNAPTSSRSQ
jgi:hypothetical protein